MDILVDSATMKALEDRKLLPSFRRYLEEHYKLRTPILAFDQPSVLVLPSTTKTFEATNLAKKHFCPITSGQQPLPRDPNKKLLAKACFLSPKARELRSQIKNPDCSVYICDDGFFNELEARYKHDIANSNRQLILTAIS